MIVKSTGARLPHAMGLPLPQAPWMITFSLVYLLTSHNEQGKYDTLYVVLNTLSKMVHLLARTDSQMKRANRTILQILRNYINRNGSDWAKHITTWLLSDR